MTTTPDEETQPEAASEAVEPPVEVPKPPQLKCPKDNCYVDLAEVGATVGEGFWRGRCHRHGWQVVRGKP